MPELRPEFAKQLDTMRAFVKEELMPLEPQLHHGFKQLVPTLNEKRAKVKALGLWMPQIHKEYGGMGLTNWEHGHVSEVLGRSPIGHYAFNCQAPDAGNMEILIEFGTDYQKETFLKPLLNGDTRSCFSMTEPDNAGSNPTMMSTTGVIEGDSYIIDGHKWFTSSADGAAFTIAMVNTQPHAESRYGRASMIIVPLDNPGYEHVRRIKIMGEEGDDYMSHSEVKYNECRVPRENLLGGDGAGFLLAQKRLGPGRIHHCMRWMGICERAFDLMCQRAASRELAPGVPLASKQTIQNWIAESRAEINAARLMVLDAAHKIDTVGAKEARQEISIIKFFAADVLMKVLDRAIQAHGAMGITDDILLSHYYRHERGARIYDGADEVHKSVVARQIMKGYGVDRKAMRA